VACDGAHKNFIHFYLGLIFTWGTLDVWGKLEIQAHRLDERSATTAPRYPAYQRVETCKHVLKTSQYEEV
jgi:hypothetical protein